jgi:hypothetical protein
MEEEEEEEKEHWKPCAQIFLKSIKSVSQPILVIVTVLMNPFPE